MILSAILLKQFRFLLNLKYLVVMLSFISFFLTLFLALACHSTSSAFSGIYLIEATMNTGDSTLRAGYYRMCETAGSLNGTVSTNSTLSSSSMVCKNLGSFQGSDLAYLFSKHVVRPYFVTISVVLQAGTFTAATVACIRSHRPFVNNTALIITSITLGFTAIAACWQQVGVQAAVTLLASEEVKRGYRAGGLVWSAVSLLILCVVFQAIVAKTEMYGDEEDNEDKANSLTESFQASEDFVNSMRTKSPVISNPFV